MTDMRYLAIDYGSKRTGLAICDPAGMIASPHSVVEGQKHLVERIAAVVKAESVGGLVVGLPLNMDGTEGPQARRVRRFAGEMAKAVGMPVLFQDERLSSSAAQDKLSDWGLTAGRRRRRLDAVAAAEILEAFLEQHRRTPMTEDLG